MANAILNFHFDFLHTSLMLAVFIYIMNYNRSTNINFICNFVILVVKVTPIESQGKLLDCHLVID